MKDSIGLLKAEITKEEAQLADEKKSLQEMDKNAKRAEAERKRQMKNVSEGVHGIVGALADTVYQEHPVLHQLDELPKSQDESPPEFTLLNPKSSQVSLEEVCASSIIPARIRISDKLRELSSRKILTWQR